MRKIGKKQNCNHVKRSAVLAALVLFVGCARQMPPPGGPADMIPPFVEKTVPGDDSVGVDVDRAIHIYFSERMDHRSVENAVFVSPQAEKPLRFRWHGSELEIRVPDGLRADRTYVVTVGQASADEWQNRMVASYSFGFATGEKLNQGELAGRVVRSKLQTGQVFVWAYDLTGNKDPDPVHDRAHYVTQPDEIGSYLFRRLGPGRYRVFAFVDGNGDQTYTPGVDALAVPPDDVMVIEDGRRVRLGDLKGAVRDTSAPKVVAVRTLDRLHVLLRFDAPVRVIGTPEILGLDVKHVYQDADSMRVGLITGDQQSGEVYDVRLQVVDRLGNRAEVQTSVKGDVTADRRAPEVMAIAPALHAPYVLPDAPLEMVFSDAMAEVISLPFWAMLDSSVAPEGQFQWAAPNHLLFYPAMPWSVGLVRLQSREGAVTDVASNGLQKPVTFEFTVVDSQTFGQVRGTVAAEDVPLVVQAVLVGVEERSYQAVVAPDDSTFEMTLLPGMYRLAGFVDGDGDGVWDIGSAKPFVGAEPLVSMDDTVEVRARWTEESRRLGASPFWFLPPVEKESP